MHSYLAFVYMRIARPHLYGQKVLPGLRRANADGSAHGLGMEPSRV